MAVAAVGDRHHARRPRSARSPPRSQMVAPRGIETGAS
ncbi:hypothetical protein BRI6_3110 [plant metagenome]|uniref:Uncharacterized protein n=1 Tax=plant metagenome TaxID=1297885 RepID=A0A484XHP4_9ZZZZ